MAEREARVRLSLVAGGYLGGLQQVGQATHAVVGKLGQGFAWFGKQAGSSVVNLTKQIGSLAATAGGLTGIFSVGSALTNATSLQSTYRDLAFAMSRATGKAVEWQAIQKQIEPVAAATGRSSKELAEAFGDVLAETGNAELAGQSLKAIGVLATASGREVKQLSSVAGALNDKLGVTADEMPNVLSAAIDLSNKGGIGFEDLTKAIHLTGASARAAGMGGAEAFSQLVAMMNRGGDALGSTKKGLSAIVQIMDQMADPSRQKAIKQTFGVDVKDKAGNLRQTQAVLADIFSKTGGKREALAKVFGGEQLKLVTELGKPFREAFEKTGGDMKTKTAAGLAAFNDAMKEAGKSGYDFAQAQEDAKKRMEDDPMRKMARAAETFNQAFSRPEVISAMGKLTDQLPRLADAAGKAVESFSKNPMEGVGVLIAGVVAKDVARAGIGAAIKAAVEKAGAGKLTFATAALAIEVATIEIAREEKEKNQKRMLEELGAGRDVLTKGNATAEELRAVKEGAREKRGEVVGRMFSPFGSSPGGLAKTLGMTVATGGLGLVAAGFATMGKDKEIIAETRVQEKMADDALRGAATKQTDAADKLAQAASALKTAAASFGGGGDNGNNGLPPSNTGTPPGFVPR